MSEYIDGLVHAQRVVNAFLNSNAVARDHALVRGEAGLADKRLFAVGVCETIIRRLDEEIADRARCDKLPCGCMKICQGHPAVHLSQRDPELWAKLAPNDGYWPPKAKEGK